MRTLYIYENLTLPIIIYIYIERGFRPLFTSKNNSIHFSLRFTTVCLKVLGAHITPPCSGYSLGLNMDLENWLSEFGHVALLIVHNMAPIYLVQWRGPLKWENWLMFYHFLPIADLQHQLRDLRENHEFHGIRDFSIISIGNKQISFFLWTPWVSWTNRGKVMACQIWPRSCSAARSRSAPTDLAGGVRRWSCQARSVE